MKKHRQEYKYLTPVDIQTAELRDPLHLVNLYFYPPHSSSTMSGVPVDDKKGQYSDYEVFLWRLTVTMTFSSRSLSARRRGAHTFESNLPVR